MKSIFIFVCISLYMLKITSKEYSDCNLWEDELSSESMQRIVDIHNEKRNKIAIGIQDGKLNKLPFATNMLKMYWSHQLAEKAQEWANNCKFEHSDLMTRKISNYPVGENLALEYRNYFHPGMNWQRAIDVWWAQQAEFISTGASVDHFEKKNLDKIGAFTQMIWANSYMVGCGFAQFREENVFSNLYVCHYAPIGNIVGLPIYYSSPFRQHKCPSGLTTDHEKFKGLCCSTKNDLCNKYVYTDEELIEGTLPTVVMNYFDKKDKTENTEQ